MKASDIPHPVSATAQATMPSWREVLRVMVPSPSMASTAFVIKFCRTRWMASVSPRTLGVGSRLSTRRRRGFNGIDATVSRTSSSRGTLSNSSSLAACRVESRPTSFCMRSTVRVRVFRASTRKVGSSKCCRAFWVSMDRADTEFLRS